MSKGFTSRASTPNRYVYNKDNTWKFKIETFDAKRESLNNRELQETYDAFLGASRNLVLQVSQCCMNCEENEKIPLYLNDYDSVEEELNKIIATNSIYNKQVTQALVNLYNQFKDSIAFKKLLLKEIAVRKVIKEVGYKKINGSKGDFTSKHKSKTNEIIDNLSEKLIKDIASGIEFL